MRWLYFSTVPTALALAVVLIAPREGDAQPIRPRPVYPSVSYYPSPDHYFAPGGNYYPPTSTLRSGSYSSMYNRGAYGSYGARMSSYGSSSYGGARMSSYGSGNSYSSAPSAAPLSAPAVDVGVYENSFRPAVLHITPGTVVRFTNRGRHHHTVTSQEGLWDSGELRPGEGYAVFFPLPGRYEYHCTKHPDAMRGRVIVRSEY